MEAAAELEQVYQNSVKDILPHMNTVVESLGIPKVTHLYGPIARDYVAFNAQTDNEKFQAAGELFNFRKTGDYATAKL